MPSTTHPAPDAEEILSLANAIMVIQRKFLVNLMGELARGKVSFPQFFLLGHLCSSGPAAMSTIALLMGHSMPASTGLVQRLEKLGYVRRTHDTEDRRKVMVSATSKATELVGAMRGEMAANIGKVMAHLDPGEQRAWVDIYRKIHDYCSSCPRP
jgi:DNA-binding MarR family transcriptional regulator